VAAFCHTHYGAVLTAAGRWPEAEAALTSAVQLWGLGHRSMLRRGAMVRLADLRVRQGKLDEAERLLSDVRADPDAAYPLAALQLARGETALAIDTLDRGLSATEEGSAGSGPLLGLLVDALLAAGRLEDAAATTQRLADTAARHGNAYLVALAALARGSVAIAAGDADAAAHLRDALTGFARADLPWELARSRLALSGALTTVSPEVALAEARAALGSFERLRASRQVDAAAAQLRALGVRTTTSLRSGGLLTPREQQVLELLGSGLSNPEISDRLFISRKTVEHHVANILAKLGLRSRAEAAAHAARRGSTTKSGPE
jgi:DNA-binding CsgD family transcriptional regulator